MEEITLDRVKHTKGNIVCTFVFQCKDVHFDKANNNIDQELAFLILFMF